MTRAHAETIKALADVFFAVEGYGFVVQALNAIGISEEMLGGALDALKREASGEGFMS